MEYHIKREIECSYLKRKLLKQIEMFKFSVFLHILSNHANDYEVGAFLRSSV